MFGAGLSGSAALWAAADARDRVHGVVAAGLTGVDARVSERLGRVRSDVRLVAARCDDGAVRASRSVQRLLPGKSDLVLVGGTTGDLQLGLGQRSLAILTAQWLAGISTETPAIHESTQGGIDRNWLRRVAITALLTSFGPLGAAASGWGRSSEARELPGGWDGVGLPHDRLAAPAANPSLIELSSLNGRTGFTLHGVDTDDESGRVSSAGDVNDDGFDDVIVGAPEANPGGYASGQTYVVFGGNGLGSVIELSGLNGTDGFVMNGVGSGDASGEAVSGAGDVNGDGFDDVIIGAPDADPNGWASGQCYVVHRGSNLGSVIELSSLDGTIGFTLNGTHGLLFYDSDMAGTAVSGAGDVDGDGYDDILIGAPGATQHGDWSGETYVVYGGSSIASEIELSSLNGTTG